jgi:hypothetical protein
MNNTNFDNRRGPRVGQPQAKTGFDEKGFAPTATERSPRRAQTSHAPAKLGDHVKALLADQVGSGADVITQFALATRKAANELDTGAPQAARLVRGLSDRLDDYAGMLRDQSVEDLARAASDYTRRQPALVFGVAALAGFLLVRTFKNASARPQRRMTQGHFANQERPEAGKGQSNV